MQVRSIELSAKGTAAVAAGSEVVVEVLVVAVVVVIAGTVSVVLEIDLLAVVAVVVQTERTGTMVIERVADERIPRAHQLRVPQEDDGYCRSARHCQC